MSGFIIRRFVLQNITAVAVHCPSTTVAAAALGVMTGVTPPPAASSAPPSKAAQMVSGWVQTMLTGSSTPADGASTASSSKFGLITPEEMAWIRQRRREDADESRIVLSTQPSRSLLRGTAGAALNVVMGFFCSPLIFFSVMVERIRVGDGPHALFVAPCYGVVWGGVFFACAQYAAVQQLCLSGYYGCVATPLYYCVNRRPNSPTTADQNCGAASKARAYVFNGLSCRFEPPQGTLHAHHPMLALYDDPAVLRERAMKRLAHRNKRDKKGARYNRNKQMNKNGAVDDDDYYGLLGLTPDATPRQIKEAYSQKALHLHPDRNARPDAAQQFDRVTKAYKVLSNPQKKKKFDLAGATGVEDTGLKKREGVRALFGGDVLNKLTGDAFLGSFSQRVIDGLDYTAEELAVVRQGMYEQCRDELLQRYLRHYDPSHAASSPSPRQKTSGRATAATTAKSTGPWRGDAVAIQLRQVLNTGLAKEVLYTVAQEYKRVLAYFDMEQLQRHTQGRGGALKAVLLPSLAVRRVKFYLHRVGPHRWQLQRQKLKYLTKVRSHTFKNSEAMVDLAWYTSVQEVEATARHVAFAVLYDPQLSAEDARTRRDALEALAETFLRYGQPYKGASKATMDQLMNSLREYQQQRQRDKEAE